MKPFYVMFLKSALHVSSIRVSEMLKLSRSSSAVACWSISTSLLRTLLRFGLEVNLTRQFNGAYKRKSERLRVRDKS